MAQPLTATYRLGLSFAIVGLAHKLRFWVDAAASIISLDGFFLIDSSGLATIQPRDAAQTLWASLKPDYLTTVQPPNWLLENRVGANFNPVASGSCSGNGTGTGQQTLNSVMVVSCRTTDFQRIRFIVPEGIYFNNNERLSTLTGMAAIGPLADIAGNLAGTFGGGSSLPNWARSKNKKLLMASNPLVGATFDLNDKFRRARGVQ